MLNHIFRIEGVSVHYVKTSDKCIHVFVLTYEERIPTFVTSNGIHRPY